MGGKRKGRERGRREGRGRLTDSAEEERDKGPGTEKDKVDEVAERGEREKGEEEVGGDVAGAVFPEDDNHGAVDHGAEGCAIIERHWEEIARRTGGIKIVR